jgi:hypothetical protein
MTTKTYCIKRKSAIGRQIEEVYDKETGKWVKEEAYFEPSFHATPEEAHTLLNTLKDGYRGKWMRLYVTD